MSTITSADHAGRIAAFAEFAKSQEFIAMSLRKKPSVDNQGNPVKPPELRESTLAIYCFMFGKFSLWMADQKLTLLDLDAGDIRRFLDRKEDGMRQLTGATVRRQYLTLIERFYKHLKVSPNPASALLLHRDKHSVAGAGGKNKEKVVLTPAQEKAFMDALPDAPLKPLAPFDGWVARRDRAMLAMMLGAGLKVSEVIGLYTTNIKKALEDGTVPIEISSANTGGTGDRHTALLRKFAAPVVLEWVVERKRLSKPIKGEPCIPGKLLFPAADGTALNKSTVFRKSKATFATAGIDVDHTGGRTLRNTHAVRELDEGGSAKSVKEQLGHRQMRSTMPYVEAHNRRVRLNKPVLQLVKPSPISDKE